MVTNVIRAFGEEDVGQLTGISRHQLRYWDRTGFFVPSLAEENRRRPLSRIYSFRDVVSLQVLNTLRNEARVPLPHLREVKEKLAHLGDDLWAKTTLYVLSRKVIFDNPKSRRKEEIVSGQGILQIPLEVVRGNTERAVQALWARDKAAIGRVNRKRGRVGNRPVLAGTRIPVASIKAFHRAGYTIRQIREQYPVLSDADIRAALSYGKAA